MTRCAQTVLQYEYSGGTAPTETPEEPAMQTKTAAKATAKHLARRTWAIRLTLS